MKCRALLSRGASTVQTSAQSSVSGEPEMILSTPPQRPLTGWYGGGQRRGLPAQTHASQGEAGTDMSTSWHTYYSRWVVSRRDGRQAPSDCLTTTPPSWPGTTSARTRGQMWVLWSTLPTHVILGQDTTQWWTRSWLSGSRPNSSGSRCALGAPSLDPWAEEEVVCTGHHYPQSTS